MTLIDKISSLWQKTTSPSFLKPLNIKYVFPKDISTVFAMDTSGSTEGNISGDYYENYNHYNHYDKKDKIIDFSKNFYRSLNPESFDKIKYVTWNSYARLTNGNNFFNSIPEGCTRPENIINHLNENDKLLVLSTDGEIYDECVPKILKMMEESSIEHVFACYVGNRNKKPCKLNLPVIAAFMEVKGVCIILHYDGKSYRILFKKNAPFIEQLPEVTEKTCWEDLPNIENVGELFKKKFGSIDIADGEIIVKDEKINVSEFLEYFTKLVQEKNNEKIQELVDSEYLEIIFENISDNKLESFRNLLKTYRNYRKSQIYEECKQENKKITEEIEKLEKQAKDSLISDKKTYQDAVKRLYELNIEQENSSKKELYPLNSWYSTLTERIANKQQEGYTLQDLSKKSNRAKRAEDVGSSFEKQETWDLSESSNCVCDICCEDRPRALLLIKVPEDICNINTGNGCLNEPMSLGRPNKNYIVSNNICVYCSYYLYKRDGRCPFTRQEIESIIVLGNLTSDVNKNMMKDAICSAFFDKKSLGICFQFFYAILNEMRYLDRISSDAFRYFAEFILFNTKANFLTEDPPKLSTSLAMEEVINYDSKYFNINEWLIPLRKKSITSSTIIISALSESYDQKQKLLDYLRKTVLKSIVDGLFFNMKRISAEKLKIRLMSELYNTRNIGIPLINSEKVIDLYNSEVMHLIWGLRYDNFKEDLNRATQIFHIKIDQLFPPELLTSFFHILSQHLTSQYKSEAFFKYMAENELIKVKNIMTMSEIDKEDVLGDLKKLYSDKKVLNVDHSFPAPFCMSHMGGPPVTYCSSCGESFVPIFGEDDKVTQEDRNEIIKSLRAAHFDEVFGTVEGEVEENSGSFNLHRITRGVIIKLLKKKEKQEKDIPDKPTVEIIEKILAKLIKENKGNFYLPNLIHKVVIVAYDFIQKYNIVNSILDFEHHYKFDEKVDDELDNYVIPKKEEINCENMDSHLIAELCKYDY